MKKIKMGWLTLFAFAMMMTMTLQWRSVNPNVAKGIIALELAKEHSEATVIVSDWNIAGAIQNTWIDFGFIIAYSAFLFAGVYRLSSKLKGWLNPVGKVLAYLAPVAGLLDVIENYKMLQFLYNQNDFASPFYVSAVKWGIAGFLVPMLLVLLVVFFFQKWGSR